MDSKDLRKDTIEQIELAVNEVMNGVFDGCYNESNMSLNDYINETYNILKQNLECSEQNGWNTNNNITSAINFDGKNKILAEIEKQLKENGIMEELKMKDEILNEDMIESEIDKLQVCGRDFWKVTVLQTVENNNFNYEEQINVTMKQVDNIVENLLNNDYMWDIIDAEIRRELGEIQ